MKKPETIDAAASVRPVLTGRRGTVSERSKARLFARLVPAAASLGLVGCSAAVWDVEEGSRLSSVMAPTGHRGHGIHEIDSQRFAWEQADPDCWPPFSRTLVNLGRAPFLVLVGAAELYASSH